MTDTATPKTSADVRALTRGQAFSIRLAKTLPWKQLHEVLYCTANREVTVTLRTGEKITGTLSETPGYFDQHTKAGARVWLRVPGRKTRKGIPARDIRHLRGYRSPTLAEALGAFVLLNASNPTADQVAESLSVARDM
jgi:hypothetical protein